jgi:hypothetical protein
VDRYNGSMKRRSALLALGAATLLPTGGFAGRLGPLGASVIRNEPKEWGRWWISRKICCVNPFFPRDGRETIYRPYERLARTDTVGAYLDVSLYLYREAYARRRPNLPTDFHAYLVQRIPESRYLESFNPASKIDAFGMIVPA